MDRRKSETELLRQLSTLDGELRPLGIRLRVSASMLRGSKRSKLAEKLFDLYSEHGVHKAYELFFEVGGEVVFELLKPHVPGADLTDWVVSVCVEFYKGRVDLSSGFEEGIKRVVLALKQERIDSVRRVLVLEFEHLELQNCDKLRKACGKYLENISWRAVEMLYLYFVEGQSVDAIVPQIETDLSEISRFLGSVAGGIDAELRKVRSDSPSDERGDEQ